ncbi:hypothetical protein M2138_002102 [Dysgonomonadaceae bacterium PH5-43]|nr:hypothetical protein [Dysgonomonadaceae bacterium PH5-43]
MFKIKNWLIGVCIIFSCICFNCCDDKDLPDINGMWKLESVKQDDNTHFVDSVYYSFQRKTIFSYTLLNPKGSNPASNIYYGYVTFPEDNKLFIKMDAMYNDLSLYPYLKNNMNFEILRLSSRKMILKKDDEIYNLIKY